MKFSFLVSTVIALVALQAAAASEDDGKHEEPKSCTVKSPISGNHFDLNPIYVHPPGSSSKKSSKDERTESWHARGYDYGTNFTINFCGPVIEPLGSVVGIKRPLLEDIGAFYTKGGKTYSIGQVNDTLLFRGRKLVVTYTNGSPCDRMSDEYVLGARQVYNTTPTVGPAAAADDDNGDGGHIGHDPAQPSKRRKSAIISLLCERDPSAPKAALSFVGASPDECAYFFEARSSAACPTINISQQQFGPSTVFGVIALIAILVYLVGGIVYQRAVMHQRGWRQIPNYNIWAGIANAFKDAFFRIFSICSRCLHRRKGYSRVNGNGIGHGRYNSDDENRLIDQLDEEWDD